MGKIHWGTYGARTEGSSRDASGVPARHTAALSWSPAAGYAAAGLPPRPDPAIRKLQESAQGNCRPTLCGDLYEYGLAL